MTEDRRSAQRHNPCLTRCRTSWQCCYSCQNDNL